VVRLNSPHKSPVLSKITETRLPGLSDLGGEPGFLKLRDVLQDYVADQTERMIREIHLSPEELRDMATEIRLFRGIIDLPEAIRLKCRKRS